MASEHNNNTGMEQLDAPIGRIKLVSSLPQTPEDYYGGSATLKDNQWRGGEIVYHSGDGTGSDKIYIQTATSGRTPTWRTVQLTLAAA